MKMLRNQHMSPAFTVFEVTVVLALMSSIITIIAVSVNRFNEQLKISSDIHQELNTFFAFRANLWTELYTSDSIHYNAGQVNIYHNGLSIEYRTKDEILERKTGKEKEWMNTGFQMQGLAEDLRENDERIISFIFDWKGEPMRLHYFCRANLKDKIDHYFEHFE